MLQRDNSDANIDMFPDQMNSQDRKYCKPFDLEKLQKS